MKLLLFILVWKNVTKAAKLNEKHERNMTDKKACLQGTIIIVLILLLFNNVRNTLLGKKNGPSPKWQNVKLLMVRK